MLTVGGSMSTHLLQGETGFVCDKGKTAFVENVLQFKVLKHIKDKLFSLFYFALVSYSYTSFTSPKLLTKSACKQLPKDAP